MLNGKAALRQGDSGAALPGPEGSEGTSDQQGHEGKGGWPRLPVLCGCSATAGWSLSFTGHGSRMLDQPLGTGPAEAGLA